MSPIAKAAGLIALLGLASCSAEPEHKPEIVRPVLSVVVEPQASRIQGFAGTIEPRYSAALAFRILGRIVSRDAHVGDVVKKGVTLAALDPVSLELQMQAARAELSSAEAQLANAASGEERQRALLATANTSKAAFEAAEQARAAAAANVERAQAALNKTEEQLGYARLYSDFDGVVTAVGAEIGQTVSPGQMVVTVARSDIREAVVDIPDQLAVTLPVGEAFAVTLQSQPTLRTEGTIREIAPQADNVTRTRRVRLTLVDPPTDFRLGSTVTATRKAHIVPTIELPLSALLEQEGKASVWVVDGPSSTVNLRDIQLASKGSRSFVVAGGLDAGMRVVTAGVHSLTPGQKVKISQEAPL